MNPQAACACAEYVCRLLWSCASSPVFWQALHGLLSDSCGWINQRLAARHVTEISLSVYMLHYLSFNMLDATIWLNEWLERMSKIIGYERGCGNESVYIKNECSSVGRTVSMCKWIDIWKARSICVSESVWLNAVCVLEFTWYILLWYVLQTSRISNHIQSINQLVMLMKASVKKAVLTFISSRPHIAI